MHLRQQDAYVTIPSWISAGLMYEAVSGIDDRGLVPPAIPRRKLTTKSRTAVSHQ